MGIDSAIKPASKLVPKVGPLAAVGIGAEVASGAAQGALSDDWWAATEQRREQGAQAANKFVTGLLGDWVPEEYRHEESLGQAVANLSYAVDTIPYMAGAAIGGAGRAIFGDFVEDYASETAKNVMGEDAYNQLTEEFNAADKAKDALPDAAGSAVSDAKQAAESTVSGAKDALSEAPSALIDTANKAGDAYAALPDDAQDMIGEAAGIMGVGATLGLYNKLQGSFTPSYDLPDVTGAIKGLGGSAKVDASASAGTPAKAATTGETAAQTAKSKMSADQLRSYNAQQEVKSIAASYEQGNMPDISQVSEMSGRHKTAAKLAIGRTKLEEAKARHPEKFGE